MSRARGEDGPSENSKVVEPMVDYVARIKPTDENNFRRGSSRNRGKFRGVGFIDSINTRGREKAVSGLTTRTGCTARMLFHGNRATINSRLRTIAIGCHD